jgi:hypothetical protein
MNRPRCQLFDVGQCCDGGALAYELIDLRSAHYRHYYCTRHGMELAESYDNNANYVVRRMVRVR